MIVTEFIQTKKRRGQHTESEIQEFIRQYASDQIPDYQVAAWLMAVCLNGLEDAETVTLTQAMVDSGERFHWEDFDLPPADKHSTGGVGDKTSLIIAPLVASFGIPVPMMAGRGLGFTGGTLDKMESIPGFETRLSVSQMKRQMKDLGFFLVGQTEEICPADKRMYSLRDVTSTVDSIPLICASILSKKIAEGTQSLVMDVKVGSGAFMDSIDRAQNLAKKLSEIGKLSGLKVTSLITDMNQPLGRFVGNALEVHECLEILTLNPTSDGFKNYQDTLDLSIELAAEMIHASGYHSELEECRKACLQRLENGMAYENFERMVFAQGGDLSSFQRKRTLELTVTADETGFFKVLSNRKIGVASVLLGGGRMKSSDDIDPQVGIEVFQNHGEEVCKGAPLFKLYYRDQKKLSSALKNLQESFEIQNEPVQKLPLIHERIV
ncbi:MAG TPA: thymidine phosphorylase [Bdellovibrionales bacterium]|nr:thymidine phosphorylase [Pseudobdellovibrionaceae bacterium]HAG90476.1 thymidine phosphorylase [Bdellovibrionales bacterium]